MDPRQQYAIDAGWGGAYAAGEQTKARWADEQYADKNLAAFKEAFGKIAPPQLTPGVKQQTGAEGQLWQGIAQQQQLAQAQASRRGFSATGARAAAQAGAELESAGYGQAAQVRAAEEARRREMAMALAQQQTGAMSQQDALATQRIQDRAAQYAFEQATAAQLEAEPTTAETIGQGFLSAIPLIGTLTAEFIKASDEDLKKNIEDGGSEADARLDALSGTLPMPQDADIRGGSFYKQTGPVMTVYMPRPGAVFGSESKKQATKEQAMPKNDYAEANEFYDMLSGPRPRAGVDSYSAQGVTLQDLGEGGPSREMMDRAANARVVQAPRVAAVAAPMAMRSMAPAAERAIPMEMTRAQPMRVANAGPSLEPDYEALAAAVQRGRENPQVESGLRAARDTFNAEAELMRRAREQQRARLMGGDVVFAPETIVARAPVAERSFAREPRVADQALNALRPRVYEYRDEAVRAGEPGGRQLGVMAQDMEQAPGLRNAVVDTSMGKGIRTADELLYDMLPLLGRVNERLRKVEGKKAPAKSSAQRQEPRMIEYARGATEGVK